MRLASERLGVSADQLVVSDGVVSVAIRFLEARHLRRARGGREVQPSAECRREAQAAARVEGAGNFGAAHRHGGDGDRSVRVRAQRARAGDAARAGRAARFGGRHGGERGRELGQRRSGSRQGCREEELRGSRRREAVAGDTGREQAESELGARRRSAQPEGFLRFSAHAAGARSDHRRFEGRRRDAGQGRHASSSPPTSIPIRCTDRLAPPARWPTSRTARRPCGPPPSRPGRSGAARRWCSALRPRTFA